jgi:hypothetical protein
MGRAQTVHPLAKRCSVARALPSSLRFISGTDLETHRRPTRSNCAFCPTSASPPKSTTQTYGSANFLTYEVLNPVFLPTTVFKPSRPQAVLLVEIWSRIIFVFIRLYDLIFLFFFEHSNPLLTWLSRSVGHHNLYIIGQCI